MTTVNKTPPLSISYVNFKNWSQQIQGSHIMSCTPLTEKELCDVVNWAKDNNYKVRPLGMMHNWSPLTIVNGDNNSNVLLVDLKKMNTKVTISKNGEHGWVTANTGITMMELVKQLEKQKLGFIATPAPGDLTLGGVLAIGGHGTGIPAKDEKRPLGGSYGSLSNSIISLRALVFNSKTGKYEIKTFLRNDPEMSAFMIHVGRALIYEVTLQVPRNQRLRCQSYVNITADEMFAKNPAGKNTFSSFLDKCGRAEAIWFPFTEKPWLKIWTVTPSYPSASVPVHSPFNYEFSDSLPVQVSNLIKKINNGHPELTPDLGKLQANLVDIGLGATNTTDIWGWSKDLLLYIRPDTLRVTANGYAILTRRDNVQSVLYDFVTRYREMVADYQSRNSWPMNGPIEVRVTGLDKPADSLTKGAVMPALSAIKPDAAHPEWDVAIWLDILTMPDTPDANKFYNEMEQWIFSHFNSDDSRACVEWSKGWAYSDKGTWDNMEMLDNIIPETLSHATDNNENWEYAVNTLNSYDPYNLFTTPFIEKLFKIK